MGLNGSAARAWPRVRRLRTAAHAGAVRHVAVLALLGTCALLGEPAAGVAAGKLAAWRRSRGALARMLDRLRGCEDEAARLRAEAGVQQQRARAELAEARQQGAA